MGSSLRLLAFITFIRENPGFAAWLIGGLFSIVAGLVVVYYGLIYRRVGTLERRVGVLEGRTSGADIALRALTERLEEHMNEEETRVWTGIDRISDKLTIIQGDHGERLARIEAQMAALSPVGCMGEVLAILRGMKQEEGK